MKVPLRRKRNVRADMMPTCTLGSSPKLPAKAFAASSRAGSFCLTSVILCTTCSISSGERVTSRRMEAALWGVMRWKSCSRGVTSSPHMSSAPGLTSNCSSPSA